jgi:hypothetical protein
MSESNKTVKRQMSVFPDDYAYLESLKVHPNQSFSEVLHIVCVFHKQTRGVKEESDSVFEPVHTLLGQEIPVKTVYGKELKSNSVSGVPEPEQIKPF